MYILTQKHFDTIVTHCRDTYPAEAGGFLGGKEDLILGIFPVFNLAFLNYTEKKEFALAEGEMVKVHAYFEQYGMKVMGFYHSHPTSELPIPSIKDVMTHKFKHLKLMLIVSLADLRSTKLAAYNVEGNIPVKQTLKVIKDEGLNKYLLKYDMQKGVDKYLGEMRKLEGRVAQIFKEHQSGH